MVKYQPIFNFKANNFLNAYILNALCASLSAIAAIKIHLYGEKRRIQCEEGQHKHFCHFYKNEIFNISAIIIFTFITTMIIFLTMNILFEYGGGMIA